MESQKDKRVVTRHYPNASEVTVCTKRSWHHHEKTATNRDEQNEAVIRSAVSRAKSTVMRKCLAIDAYRMVTLTMPGDTYFNDQDIDEAWLMFRAWLQRLRRKNLRFHYVAVPEKQGRGAWHFHVAVNEFIPIKVIQREWNQIGGGNVDVKHFKNRFTSSKTEGCAGYIAKYIGKELESSVFSRNRYRTSQGIKIDVERVDLPEIFFSSLNQIKETFRSITGMVSGRINRYRHVVTICSWGDGVNDYRAAYDE